MARKIISCPACNARFDVAKYPAGSRVRCGRCSQVLTVPMEADLAAGLSREAPRVLPSNLSQPAPAAPAGTSRSVSRSASGPRTRVSQEVPSLAAQAAPRRDAPVVATAVGVAAAPDRDPLIDRVVNGQFRVVRKLGEGGYGAVYEAKDVNLERRIALKIMLPSRAASREYVAKFFREARTAAQLSHPNVVAVHGVGLDKDNNVYFLAMEYVEGRTIHDILQERGPLPVEECVAYIGQSCRGLAAAHERNIIHRDIKPGNLMVTPNGVLKIADFGLAKVYEGEGEQQSTVIGTPYFMPPEQFEGRAKDGRTDIYALGVTFYYMLTMQRAHSGAGPAQILLSVMTKEPTSVLEHRPELPEGIWPIVRRMIDRDVERRYTNCLDIARDLELLLGGGAAATDVEQVYCPNCGAGNAVDATACTGCKVSLLEKCPACGVEDAAGTKFCGNCGANIPAERAAQVLAEEGRKLLEIGQLGRAREKVQRAQERSADNVAVAELLKELETAHEQLDAHRDTVRDLLARGRVQEASERLERAKAQFPQSDEIADLAIEVEAAIAGPESTGAIPGASAAMGEARRLEEAGKIREALVAWRGVGLLLPNAPEPKLGEARTSERVQRAEALVTEGTELLTAGDPEAALARLVDANAVLPMDPLVEGRLKEALRAAEDLRSELTSILAETGAPNVTLGRLRALAERFPGSAAATEALARAEQAGREANRGAVRERLAKAIATAKKHEQGRRLKDALQAWREALSLDPDCSEAQAGIGGAERRLAEFDAVLTQSRNLLAARDPEGAERTAAEALAIVTGDPAAEAQLARARTQVETLRHEAERIRTALKGEEDDEVLSWARDLATRYAGSALAAELLRETEEKFKEAEQKAAGKEAAELLENAKKLEAEASPPQALRAYQDVLARAPEHVEAREAIQRITKRMEDAAAKAALANELLEAGDPEGARAAAEKSLELISDQRGPAGTLAGARTAMTEIERVTQSFTTTLPVEEAEQQLERFERLFAKYPKSNRCAEFAAKARESVTAARGVAVRAKVLAHTDAARAALVEGRLGDAMMAAQAALNLDADDPDAKEALETSRRRGETAQNLYSEGVAAANAGRHADARAKFIEALEANPQLTEATRGREAADASLEKRAAALAQTLSQAVAATRSSGLLDAQSAWQRVLALDPDHAQAKDELEKVRSRIERAQSDVEKGRAALEAGDPEAAVPVLEAARSTLGAGAWDALLAKAREGAQILAKGVRDIEAALASNEGELDPAVKLAESLAASFPGNPRAKDAAAHAVSAAAERRRTLAVARVRKLVAQRRYGEARDLAASLRGEGVVSRELDAAAQQADQAITKLDSLRRRADEGRKGGRLTEARDALKELLVSLPDDVDTKSQLTEIEETIREITARRDAAESARRRGSLSQAIELYREALALQGADPTIEEELPRLAEEVDERVRLLRACHDAIRVGEGRTCADTAKQLLERYPDDDDARDLHTTGECLDKMVGAMLSRAQRQLAAGERDGAQETLECLLRVAPENAKAKELLSA